MEKCLLLVKKCQNLIIKQIIERLTKSLWTCQTNKCKTSLFINVYSEAVVCQMEIIKGRTKDLKSSIEIFTGTNLSIIVSVNKIVHAWNDPTPRTRRVQQYILDFTKHTVIVSHLGINKLQFWKVGVTHI